MSYVFQASVTMTMVTFAIFRRNSQTLTCYFSTRLADFMLSYRDRSDDILNQFLCVGVSCLI